MENSVSSRLFIIPLYFLLVSAFFQSVAFAQNEKEAAPGPSTLRPDTDGVLEEDEYEVISMNGGLTRKTCPYTCEMRGIDKSHCKEWKSTSHNLCYVEDTSLSQNAVKPDGN